MDDENEIPLKVMASFSASHFALPSIPLIVVHILVRSVFWSMVSTKSLHFSLVCVRRCGSGYRNSVLAVQARWDLFYGGHLVLSSHKYICWYRFFVESVSSSRDVVGRCFE